MFRQALQVSEASGGAATLEVSTLLNNLAVCAIEGGRFGEAEPFLLRSMRIREALLPNDHPTMITLLQTYALLLTKENQTRFAGKTGGRSRCLSQPGRASQVRSLWNRGVTSVQMPEGEGRSGA